MLSSSSHQDPDKHMLTSVWVHQQPSGYTSPSIYQSKHIHHWSAGTKTTINTRTTWGVKKKNNNMFKTMIWQRIFNNIINHLHQLQFSQCSLSRKKKDYSLETLINTSLEDNLKNWLKNLCHILWNSSYV